MHNWKHKTKTVGLSGLLAVFLFVGSFQTMEANVPTDLKIIFKLSSPDVAARVASRYHITDVSTVFTNPFLGTVLSGSIESSLYHSLRSDSDVLYAEINQQVRMAELQITQLVTTNDPYFTTDPTDEDRQWYLPKTFIPEAWQYSKGSPSVTVAVLDTGIHANHVDLDDGRIIEGYDAVADVPILANANSDDNGHGTAIAGIIGAIPNNQRGATGINWNIQIMPVKVLKADGFGDIATISEGIIWAADHGADIINMSLGGSGFGNDITMANAIAYAFNKGAVIVSAAGNDNAANGNNLDTNPTYPVCADNGQNHIIGVAAVDSSDRKADFSNFGITCIDISAPGKRILTTAFLPTDPSNNILIYGSGTSVATPIVSGVAALIKARDMSMTNVQIRDLILKTADNIDALNQNNCLGSSCNGFLGRGRINALRALSPQPLIEGALFRDRATSSIYTITQGTKRYVSSFVFDQRGYRLSDVIDDSSNVLNNVASGPALMPLEGTLIKAQTDPTVYFIHQGVKRPLTFLVFRSRNFSFANVKTLPDPDVNVLATGEWYWPPDGTTVLIKGDPTVFAMHQQVARPVTYYVFTQRKLSFARVITVTPDEFSHLPRPADTFWLAPLDGTLVKSVNDPTVYVIEEGRKHAMSGQAFTARKYRFTNIKVLPQAEMDVIAPGEPILQ